MRICVTNDFGKLKEWPASLQRLSILAPSPLCNPWKFSACLSTVPNAYAASRGWLLPALCFYNKFYITAYKKEERLFHIYPEPCNCRIYSIKDYFHWLFQISYFSFFIIETNVLGFGIGWCNCSTVNLLHYVFSIGFFHRIGCSLFKNQI